MPRKKGQAPEAVAKERQTRWRYLLRNPEFQKDIRALRSKGPIGDHSFFKILSSLRAKWGIDCSCFVVKGTPHLPDVDLNPSTVEVFEKTFEEVYDEWRKGDYIIENPVSACDFYDEGGDDVEPPAWLRRGEFLSLLVDLSYPYYFLTESVAQKIRQALTRRGELQKKGLLTQKPPYLGERRRLDKVDFYLTVYDRALRGARFSQIASNLKQRVSTVKSAFLATKSAILGQNVSHGKKRLVLSYVDASSHINHCKQCANADVVEKMCSFARTYANQDYKSQRERPKSQEILDWAIGRTQGRRRSHKLPTAQQEED